MSVYYEGKRLVVLATLILAIQQVRPDKPYREFIKEHEGISEFFDLLQTSPLLRSVILWKQGSLFVPKNEAIENFYASGRSITNTTLLYHFCNFQMSYDQLVQERSISTETTGNLAIWVSKTSKGLYLNNAKYLDSNYSVYMQSGDSESAGATIVHIIDQVLEPTVPGLSDSKTNLHNPDAAKFLIEASSYDVSDQLVTTFRGEVVKTQTMKLFKQAGILTYFVPVNTAFTEHPIPSNAIDSEVIHGHIISGKSIFLRALDGTEEFESYKMEPNTTGIKGQLGVAPPKPFSVIISLEKVLVDGREIWLVYSDNRHGDKTHRKGVVQTEIVRGNIPVKNGVVHLISKPLVIIDMNIYQTFEWYGTRQNVKPMQRFFELFQKLLMHGVGLGIRSLLQGQGSSKRLTFFVPSNEAIEKSADLHHRFNNNLTALEEIFLTHIVLETVSADDMIELSKMKKLPFQIQTTFPRRKLLFSYFLKDGKKIIHVEGGGVNATVIRPDFGATNGYIHIIDRVLGTPDQTVQEKLRIHPMLQSSYYLWQKSKLADILNQSQTLTLFAPSDNAWNKIRRTSDAAYQNFFDGTSLVPTLADILKRHLILNQVYTIEDLVNKSLILTANQVKSKGLNENATDLNYPIRTWGSRGFVKVNSSNILLSKGDHHQLTTSPLPVTDKQRSGVVTNSNESHFYVYWDRTWAHVIRSNVRCTNGIIHIIDDVLMDNEEVSVAGTSGIFPLKLVNLFLFAFFIILN